MSTWFTAPNKNYGLIFDLPPNASFSFPYSDINENQPSLIKQPIAFARLKIPANWTGVINIPLVVAGMKGEAKVNFANQVFSTKTIMQNDFLAKNKNNFFYEIELLENTKGLEIIYHINPIVFALEKENNLCFQGDNIAQLSVELMPKPDDLKRKINIFNDSIAKRNFLRFQKKDSILYNKLLNVKEWNHLIEALNVYYNQQKEIGAIQQKNNLNATVLKLNTFVEGDLKEQKQKWLLNYCKPCMFELLIIIAESNTKEDFNTIINSYFMAVTTNLHMREMIKFVV